MVIYKDLFIAGGRNSETLPAAVGDVRAFDVRTGKMRWDFHTIPQPGEFGYNTWPPEAYKTIGAANNYWAGRYNPSLNTASLKDMKKMMASWPKPLDGPETWFELRAARVHPFEAVELARLLTQQFTY